MSIRVAVKQEDIQRGIRYAGSVCPIAQAVKRRFPKSFVYVSGDGTVRIGNNSYVPSYCEKRVANFISQFDNFARAKPFNFTLYKKKTNA